MNIKLVVASNYNPMTVSDLCIAFTKSWTKDNHVLMVVIGKAPRIFSNNVIGTTKNAMRMYNSVIKAIKANFREGSVRVDIISMCVITIR